MKSLLMIGGLLHFVILIASAMTPHLLDWRSNLATLHPFLRRLFWVYGGFIVLIIISFGTLTLFKADELASGTPLARSISAMIAIFWLARLGVQFSFSTRAHFSRPHFDASAITGSQSSSARWSLFTAAQPSTSIRNETSHSCRRQWIRRERAGAGA
jgi:hypothetical protein